MEEIVVNDTNIFIDLFNINLLNEFFELPVQIHTTDFVISELTLPEQKEMILGFHKMKRLVIKKHTAQEVARIAVFNAECENNVSITDCSVWLYAKENNYRLITGDNKLRKSAIESGTIVSGIFYIFDLLVEQGIITPQKGCEKLMELSATNCRLPSREVANRLNAWSRGF